MATGPSPRVRQEFRKYLTNTVASEGEPAALGKSATGPVYYTDYDSVVHKNRVWFRKGANKEIIGVARADNQGLPDVPNLPIRVARRFGSNWVVDWQRENAAVPTGGGGGGVSTGTVYHVLPAKVFDNPFSGATFDANGAGSFGPAWNFPDSSTPNVHTHFGAKRVGTTVNVRLYLESTTTGDCVFSVTISGFEEDEPAVGGWGGGVQSTATKTISNTGVQMVDYSFSLGSSAPVAEGDLLSLHVRRLTADAADTLAATVDFVGALVWFDEDSNGGETSTASGVHKFSPAQMLAAQNASETSVNSLATPAIAIPDSGATPTINVAFLAEKTSATLDIDIYAVTASGSGDVVLDADAYSGATDGTGTPTDNNGFVTDGTFAADGNIRKFTLTVAFTTQPDLTPGDYCSARIQRLVASGDDTLAADLHVLMIVVTENGDG